MHAASGCFLMKPAKVTYCIKSRASPDNIRMEPVIVKMFAVTEAESKRKGGSPESCHPVS